MAKKETESISPEQIEAELEEFASTMERLRVRYEQYFLGIERIAPGVMRTNVVRLMHQLEHYAIRNTAQKFRLRNLVQKFHSYSTYWNRTLREIEQGTYVRHVQKAQRKEAKRAMAEHEKDEPNEAVEQAEDPEEQARAQAAVNDIASAAEEFMASFGSMLSPPKAAKAPAPKAHEPEEEATPPDPPRSISMNFDDDDDDFDMGFTNRAQTGMKSIDIFGGAAEPAARTVAPVAPPAPESTRAPAPLVAAAPRMPARAAETGVASPQSAARYASSAVPLPPAPRRTSSVQNPVLTPEAIEEANKARSRFGTPAPPPSRAALGPSTHPVRQRPPMPTGPAMLGRLPLPQSPPPTSTPTAVAPSIPATAPLAAAPPASRPQRLAMPTARPQSPTATGPRLQAPAAPAARPQAPAAKAARPQAPAAPAARPQAPMPSAAKPQATPANNTRRVYDEFIAARSQVGATGKAMTFDKFERSLEEQASRVKKTHGCRDVDFEVVVKDGKTILKPIPKN